MRQNALPILEADGVDLVLAGHSHSYERSLPDRRPLRLVRHLHREHQDRRRRRARRRRRRLRQAEPAPAPHDGAVYVVAGSSGQIGGGTLNHPAMFVSVNRLGSLVLDFDGERLDVTTLDSTGGVPNVADTFTILKGVGTGATPTSTVPAPTVTPTPTRHRNPRRADANGDPDDLVAQQRRRPRRRRQRERDSPYGDANADQYPDADSDPDANTAPQHLPRRAPRPSAAGSLALTATPSLVKGKHRIDLVWTPVGPATSTSIATECGS